MEDGHIEIELTPIGPDRRDRAGSSRPSVQSSPPLDGDDDGHGRSPYRDRRLIVAAAAVGLAALLMGWVIGRATSPPSAQSAPTTLPPPTSEPIRRVDTLDTMPPVVETRPPSTARPPTQITAPAVEEPRVETVQVDPRLAGVDLQIVGLGFFNEVQELDLAAGTVTHFGVVSSQAWQVVAGDDWIVLPVVNGFDSYVIGSDGVVTQVDLGQEAILGVPANDTFWVIDRRQYDIATEMIEVDLDGQPTGARIELPANTWPDSADPSGGVVVMAGGTWFTLTPERAEELGHGDLIALGERTVVTYECAGELECGLWWRDRSSGDLVAVPPTDVLDGASYASSRWWGQPVGTGLSADGTLLATAVQAESGFRLFIIDLRSGEATEMVGDGGAPPLSMWADDRFLLFVDVTQRLQAYDIATGETFPVVTDGLDAPTWVMLTVRPRR